MAQRQLFITYTAEGTTDYRFFESIINTTFEQLSIRECNSQIDVYTYPLETSKVDKDFPQYVVDAANEAVSNYGSAVLVVHSDSDKDTYQERINHKFIPAQGALDELPDLKDVILVPIVPIRMIEAWMLADKELFRRQLGTPLTDGQLNIAGDPEQMADPKSKIEDAIRIAKENSSHKKPVVPPSISELYETIGQQISIEKLETLSSFQLFEVEVKKVFVSLGLSH